MPFVLANNTGAVVTSGGTTAITGTETWTVSSVTGFPSSLAAGQYFHVADVDVTKQSEKIKVTAIAGSTWTVVRGDEGTAAVAHTAGFSVAEVLTAGDLGELTQTFNVKSLAFGAKGDGSTDDSTAIGSALTAAGNAGGGTVSFPPGTFISGPQSIPQNVRLQGAGIEATTLKLKATAGQFDNLLINAQLIGTTFDADCCQVCDMTLDGNRFSQTATNPWQAGLVFSSRSPSGAFEFNDARHQASNLLIQNFTGTGFVQVHRGVCQVSDVQVWDCGAFGFNVNEDCEYSNCDAGGCGLDGFLVQGSSNAFSSCKSWFSGAALTSTQGGSGATALSVTAPTGAGAPFWDGGTITGGLTFSLANGWGNGLNTTNISSTSASTGGDVSLSGFIAQDNSRAGFRFNGFRVSATGLDADSNSNTGTTTGTTPLASFAGIELTGSGNTGQVTISGMSWDRAANGSHQQGGLFIDSSVVSANIDIVTGGHLNDGTTPMPALISGSSVPASGVMLVVNGAVAGPLGYLTGAGTGGTVTQATNKGTGVTLNKVTGQITMNAASLAANTAVNFTLTNSFITATDLLLLQHVSGGTFGNYQLTAQCASGTATIRVLNTTGGALTDAVVIGFAVIKGATT